MGIYILGRSSFDEFERFQVTFFKLVGGMTKLPLGGGAGGRRGRGGRRQIIDVVIVHVEIIIHFMESIHVQLTNERSDIGVFKVQGQHLGELFAGEHSEGHVIGAPSDEMGYRLVL